MDNVLLFITIPLSFVAYFSAGGMFEAAGGIDVLRSKKGRFARVVFWPLTYKVSEDAPLFGYETELTKASGWLSIPVFFFMCVFGYSQYLVSDTSARIAATLYAALVVISVCIAVL